MICNWPENPLLKRCTVILGYSGCYNQYQNYKRERDRVMKNPVTYCNTLRHKKNQTLYTSVAYL